jgi:hypothetical protein
MAGTGPLAAASELPPAPGMGAERMGMTWLADVLPPDTGYRPRHRSTRQGELDIDGLEDSWHDHLPEPESSFADAGPSSDIAEVTEDRSAQCFLDQMTVGDVRRILEGCALQNVTRVVPELVQLIAHSSHTPATITRAWSEFEEATRDVYASHLRYRSWSAVVRRAELGACPHDEAAESVVSYADYAWQLITQGPVSASAPSAVPATATRTR